MVVVVIIIAAGSFYGGMQYGTSKATAAAMAARGGTGGFGGQRGGGAGQGGAQGGGARGGANGGGGFVNGQIVSSDATSITIKTANGGSKIVFFSPSTGIDKSVAGASSDLSTGQQVLATGTANPDGSVTAQTIQIRPSQPNQPAQQQ